MVNEYNVTGDMPAALVVEGYKRVVYVLANQDDNPDNAVFFSDVYHVSMFDAFIGVLIEHGLLKKELSYNELQTIWLDYCLTLGGGLHDVATKGGNNE
jgi:hypothetical protein